MGDSDGGALTSAESPLWVRVAPSWTVVPLQSRVGALPILAAIMLISFVSAALIARWVEGIEFALPARALEYPSLLIFFAFLTLIAMCAVAVSAPFFVWSRARARRNLAMYTRRLDEISRMDGAVSRSEVASLAYQIAFGSARAQSGPVAQTPMERWVNAHSRAGLPAPRSIVLTADADRVAQFLNAHGEQAPEGPSVQWRRAISRSDVFLCVAVLLLVHSFCVI